MRAILFLMFGLISVSVHAQNRELSTFFDNGNVKSRYEYANSQTYSFSNFFISGKLMETGSFYNGKQDGVWATYNEAGIKTAEAFFKMGNKTGEWRIFDDLGILRYKITHDSNKIVHASNFDTDGHEIAELFP